MTSTTLDYDVPRCLAAPSGEHQELSSAFTGLPRGGAAPEGSSEALTTAGLFTGPLT